MKKILFLLSFIFAGLCSTAQTIECNGTYMVVEPKHGVYVKDCNVCVNDKYAEIYLFDKDVVVPVYKTEHLNVDNICGMIYYLDESFTSYIIFYGESDDVVACMVSVVSLDERWTFARYVKNR